MDELNQIKHDLNRDIHNLYSLLNFIKESKELKDEELKLMLDKNLERQKKVNDGLEQVFDKSKADV